VQDRFRYAKKRRKSWAALIKSVYKVDFLQFRWILLIFTSWTIFINKQEKIEYQGASSCRKIWWSGVFISASWSHVKVEYSPFLCVMAKIKIAFNSYPVSW
jgi:hypothetical protein